MPPSSKSKSKPQARDARRSHSRNTTPISAGVSASSTIEPTSAATYLRTSIQPLTVPLETTIEGIFDRASPGNSVPTSTNLNAAYESIRSSVLSTVSRRGEVCDRVLRELSTRQKERLEHDRERARATREVEDRKHKLKKISKKRDPDEERPLAVGAHGVARQDGVDVHKDTSSTISSPVSQAPPSADTGAIDSVPSPSDSEASHQPSAAPAVPNYQTFGPDPSTFDDPTIYHIRDLTPDMHEDERKEIYCVADYPRSDLHDLTPGTPPDKDFSSAKPASQVSATVFANYVEPYIRPLTEEDIAFLKERGDRVTPFIMPRRGPRHYKEVWAEEDGAMSLDPPSDPTPQHEPRGSIEMLGDSLLETDEISSGPILARLLALTRVSNRSIDSNEPNGASDSMDLDGDNASVVGPNNPDVPASATHMSESETPGWKPPAPPGKTDYATLDERILSELRHIGFISPQETEPDYSAHFDDEIAARLRYLQSELRRMSVLNGARKARILELTMERMAQQEYNTIADDLDNQLNQAYMKRNRNIGKGKNKTKRPGGPGGGSHVVNVGVGKPSVGEPIRLLMERKGQWNNVVGPVVNYGKATVPPESIFGEDKLGRLVEKEQEGWNEVDE